MSLHPPQTRPVDLAVSTDPGGRHGRLPRLVRTALSIALIAALLIVPAYVFVALTTQTNPHPVVATQVDVEGAAPDPHLVQQLRAEPTDPAYPPAVITYHDISDDGAEYTVTPQAFADQMRLLHDSGWHALTAAEFINWLHGAALPRHSVLITFDDGARGVWRYADPVFRRYGQHGVAFIITGFVGTHAPYYMTWPELERMRTDGRWDLEAHTYLGHVKVTADASGNQLPFLSTTEWLPGQHRSETLAEFSTRVRDDLTRCIDDLVARGNARPQLFAFPFSAVGADAVGERVHQVVSGLYQASFLDSPAGRPTTQQEMLKREFRRVDMLRSTTQSGFVKGVEDSLQQLVTTVTPTNWRQQQWRSTSTLPVRIPASGPVPLSASLAHNKWGEIQLDPDRTSFWTNYRETVVGVGLRDNVSVSVNALLNSPDQVQVVVGASDYSVYHGVSGAARLVQQGTLNESASRHTIEVTVQPGKLTVRVDGDQIAQVATNARSRGGIALGGDAVHQPTVPQVESVALTSVPAG